MNNVQKDLYAKAIQKSDMFLSDLGANGQLDPIKANEFFMKAEEASVFGQYARVEILNRKEAILPRLAFQSRVSRPGIEGKALTEAQRYKPTVDSMTITTKKIKAEIALTEEVLEDNVEQEGFWNSITDGLIKRIAFDVDDLVLNGDTASADPFYALFDGALKLAGNTINAGGVVLSPTVLNNTLIDMPDKHRRNFADLAYFSSPISEINYRNGLSTRATGLGDEYLETNRRVRYYGMPIVNSPAFIETAPTQLLLTNPMNMVIGYYENIRFSRVIDERAGVVYLVATYWVGFNYEDSDAVVKTTNIALS